MPELIRRGHIYIAQPPLYKVKKGKQERYVKDDAELNAYLLQLALDGARLHVNSDAPTISETGFETLAQEYMRIGLLMNRMQRRFNRDVLEAMVNQAPLLEENLKDADKVAAYGKELVATLNASLSATSQYVASPTEIDGLYGVHLVRRVHGNDKEITLDPGFFRSADYRSLASLAMKLVDMLGQGAYVARGERERPVETFKEAMDWLISESKRGLYIQRYKGLGEMNPSQLWETTMDPEARRMLQVNIEDAIAADEVFDTLMGDQVEPRREFIEKNALSVSNLDV
jgi:DNA gyrase subunit B